MQKRQRKKTVADFLMEYAKSDPVSFHMPGHKNRIELYEKAGYGAFARDLFRYDITEIPGADVLVHPTTVIREVMDNYAELYGVYHTELLVNGSSAGLIAAILNTVPRGGTLILGRNSHYSVFSALRLGGIHPVYVSPRRTADDLEGAISARDVAAAIARHPEASAVLITSPNYYGILSDIEDIAVEAHAANMILIVDQAHGAHLPFFDREMRRKQAAENQRADLVVNSAHKTLMSLTGSAILNICTDRVNIGTLSEKVRMLQTTSPSYLLMGSLDVNEKILREFGEERIRQWEADLRYFYREAARIVGLKVMDERNLDHTKINLSMRELGIDGNRLSEELQERNIWVEMVYGDYVMLMTGMGNRRGDYEQLLDALRYISNKYGISEPAPAKGDVPDVSGELELRSVPVKWEHVPLLEAEGRVAYNPLTPYPPGTPAVCPGEVLNRDVIDDLLRRLQNGDVVLGVDEEGRIEAGV